MAFKPLPVAELQQMLAGDDPVNIVDVRDEGSFATGHIAGSISLMEFGIDSFINESNKTTPLVMVCYHGNSSQHAATYMLEQGFKDVYSLVGGYTAWAAR